MNGHTLLFNKINSLPKHLREEALDFIEFLLSKRITLEKNKKTTHKKINWRKLHTADFRNPSANYSRKEMYNENDQRGG